MLDQGALDLLFALEREAGPGLVKELCGLFSVNLPATMLELSAALRAENSSLITDRAHYLKSSCRHFGALEMAGLLEKLETQAPSRDFAAMGALLQELEQAAVQVSAEIAALARLAGNNQAHLSRELPDAPLS